MLGATHENITYNSDIDILYHVKDGPPSYTASHWHNSMEIVYILSGDEDVRVDERRWTLKAGEFVIVNPRQIHSFINKSGVRSLLLQISYSYLKNFIPDIDRVTFHFGKILQMPELMEQYTKIREDMDRIVRLYPLPTPDSILLVHSLIFDLLYRLRHYFSQEISAEKLAASARYMERLGIIADYIRKHYKENLTVTQVADLVSLNPDYFTRFFRKYMGMTFLEYLNSVRMEHIFVDLLETDLSINELLEIHGFTNYKLFMRLFRTRYKKTPNQLRLQVNSRTDSALEAPGADEKTPYGQPDAPPKHPDMAPKPPDNTL